MEQKDNEEGEKDEDERELRMKRVRGMWRRRAMRRVMRMRRGHG